MKRRTSRRWRKEQLKLRLSRQAWKGRYYRAKHRTVNRWYDIRAVMAGYCNDRPWGPHPAESRGGYAHWRCARQRGHWEVHRSLNYVWGDTGDVEYDPLPHDVKLPHQPWERSMTLRLRDQRARNRWHRERERESRERFLAMFP